MQEFEAQEQVTLLTSQLEEERTARQSGKFTKNFSLIQSFFNLLYKNFLFIPRGGKNEGIKTAEGKYGTYYKNGC